MIVLTTLYKLLIGPLELFFEVLFTMAYRLVADPGLAIIFLSLAMNFLVLPLYRRADAMQEEERDRAMAMKPWVSHIKKTFSGDERFMILQTYYRQVGYKQTDTLKGSLSLMLEIPFFIAAYHFLSHLELLAGVPFGPIPDLGSPDALIALGGITINALPILMTLINVVSAAVYMKGFPISSKIQMYGVAAIFLVLLYNSPAGLVFYWTLNNLFSLFKNLFYKAPNPKMALTGLAALAGLVFIFIVYIAHPLPTHDLEVFLVVCGLLLQLPLLYRLVAHRFTGKLKISDATPADGRTFALGCLFLALLTGLFIPVTVIHASPAEFVNMMAYKSPLWFLVDSTALALGVFVIWFGVFYRLATPKGKSIFGFVIWVMVVGSIINYMLFGTNYGNLSPQLIFDRVPVITQQDILVNLAVLIAAALLLLVIWKKKRVIARVVYLSMCVAVIAMSVYGAMGINDKMDLVKRAVAKTQERGPHVTLSKEGQNVVVIMLDRSVSYYLPYMMNESPELAQQLQGFTLYPNTVSFGAFTNVGVPGIYGGYDYTPEKMNERNTITLGEKQNEALRLMPVLFNEAGYDVTVFDPTYAGYTWIPDLSIYDDHPSIKSYMTMNGTFEYDGFDQPKRSYETDGSRSRNFFCYALFKASPLALQPIIYDQGRYNAASSLIPKADVAKPTKVEAVNPQTRDGLSMAVGVDEEFMDSFAVLYKLPEITVINEEVDGAFLMMSNDTAHEPMLLKEPEYVPAPTVDNTAFDADHPGRADADGNYIDFSGDVEGDRISKRMHYQINMAAFQELGAWFDFMRVNDVYDNTRIIIVSDHACNLWLEPDLIMETDGGETYWDPLMFNCMMLVKDFDSEEFTVDTTFMTNADTPALAMQGLIENPVNPYTGNPVSSAAKQGAQHLLWSWSWDIDENNGTEFIPGDWFSVHDDVFDRNNWEYLGYY